MMSYELVVNGKMPYDPKTRLTVNAKSLDNVRKRIVKEFLTKDNVVDVFKIRKDASTEYLGCVMVIANPIWMVNDHGKRTMYDIDLKTGKIRGN